MKQPAAFARRGVVLGVFAMLGMVKDARAQEEGPPGGNGTQSASPGPAPPPQSQRATSAAETQNLEQLPANAVVAILGKKVRDPAGRDMGLVVDVLVDADGLPRAAIIDFGGFLGVGSRKIAIEWVQLQFIPGDADAPIVLALDRAVVQTAPEYKPTGQQPIQIVGPPDGLGGSYPTGGK